jgi:hypothetical protein
LSTSPLLDPDRHQSEVRLVEVLRPLHLASNLQPPIQPISPAVVGTLQAAPVALGDDYLGGAVAADVVETTQPAVEAPSDQDWFVEDGRGL